MSLNQFALVGVGGWFYLRFAYVSDAIPSPVLLIIAGIGTMIIGTLIGLPALRLSGLSLALVTLMFAAFAEVFFNNFGFPDGNNGWQGNADSISTTYLTRPSYVESNTSMWFYVVIVAALMFLLLWFFLKGRPGRAWAAIRQSEPGAASMGVNITGNKMLALAVVSFTTGVAGGLLAIPNGRLDPLSFAAVNNIILFAVVLIGGTFSLVGAILAGLLNNAFPTVLETIVREIPPIYNFFGAAFTNLILVIFGAGLIQALWTSPRGIAGNFAMMGQALNTVFTKHRSFLAVRQFFLVLVIPPILLLTLGAVRGLLVTIAIWLAVWAGSILGKLMGKGGALNRVGFWIGFIVILVIGVAGVLVPADGQVLGSWILFIIWIVLLLISTYVLPRKLKSVEADEAKEAVNA